MHAHAPPDRCVLMQPLGSLPDVPPNVRFEYHENQCYDWGTMGWVFSNKLVDPNKYTYFIFMNASVRGPFIPPYLWVRDLLCFLRLALEALALLFLHSAYRL